MAQAPGDRSVGTPLQEGDEQIRGFGSCLAVAEPGVGFPSINEAVSVQLRSAIATFKHCS